MTYSHRVPATRTNLDHDAKRAEILDSAEKLLLRDGYDTTTMAAIARDAGIANNAVYWYYPGKDDLLAAVLQRRQQRGLVALQERAPRNAEKRVLALLEQLDQVSTLTATVHERAAHSTAVAEQHAAFHEVAERYLDASLRGTGLTAQNSKRTAAAIMAMIEGIHLHEPARRDTAARDRLVLWALRRLIAASQPPVAAKPAHARRPAVTQTR